MDCWDAQITVLNIYIYIYIYTQYLTEVVHLSHFLKYFITYFHVTTLKKLNAQPLMSKSLATKVSTPLSENVQIGPN